MKVEGKKKVVRTQKKRKNEYGDISLVFKQLNYSMKSVRDDKLQYVFFIFLFSSLPFG